MFCFDEAKESILHILKVSTFEKAIDMVLSYVDLFGEQAISLITVFKKGDYDKNGLKYFISKFSFIQIIHDLSKNEEYNSNLNSKYYQISKMIKELSENSKLVLNDEPDIFLDDSLEEAIERNDIPAVRKLIQLGESPNSKIHNGPAIAFANEQKREEIEKILIKSGGLPLSTDDGLTTVCSPLTIPIIKEYETRNEWIKYSKEAERGLGLIIADLLMSSDMKTYQYILEKTDVPNSCVVEAFESLLTNKRIDAAKHFIDDIKPYGNKNVDLRSDLLQIATNLGAEEMEEMIIDLGIVNVKEPIRLHKKLDDLRACFEAIERDDVELLKKLIKIYGKKEIHSLLRTSIKNNKQKCAEFLKEESQINTLLRLLAEKSYDEFSVKYQELLPRHITQIQDYQYLLLKEIIELNDKDILKHFMDLAKVKLTINLVFELTKEGKVIIDWMLEQGYLHQSDIDEYVNDNFRSNNATYLIMNYDLDQKIMSDCFRCACYTGTNEIINILISKGFDITSKENRKHLIKSKSSAKYIIDYEIQVDSDEAGEYFGAACQHGYTDLVKYFISKGFYISNKSPSWSFKTASGSYLYIALLNGNLPIANCLIKNNIELDIDQVQKCFEVAISNGYTNIAKYLISEGASVNSNSFILIAATNCHTGIIQLLISNGASAIATDKKFQGNPITISIEKGNLSAIEFLLRKIKMDQNLLKLCLQSASKSQNINSFNFILENYDISKLDWKALNGNGFKHNFYELLLKWDLIDKEEQLKILISKFALVTKTIPEPIRKSKKSEPQISYGLFWMIYDLMERIHFQINFHINLKRNSIPTNLQERIYFYKFFEKLVHTESVSFDFTDPLLGALPNQMIPELLNRLQPQLLRFISLKIWNKRNPKNPLPHDAFSLVFNKAIKLNNKSQIRFLIETYPNQEFWIPLIALTITETRDLLLQNKKRVRFVDITFSKHSEELIDLIIENFYEEIKLSGKAAIFVHELLKYNMIQKLVMFIQKTNSSNNKEVGKSIISSRRLSFENLREILIAGMNFNGVRSIPSMEALLASERGLSIESPPERRCETLIALFKGIDVNNIRPYRERRERNDAFVPPFADATVLRRIKL